MDHAGRVDAVARELETMAAAVAAGPLSSPVATCPDWTVADLVRHVGDFCGFWAHVLCEGTGRPKTSFEPAADADLLRWFGAVGRDLLAQLEATPATTPVWTWYEPDRSAGFVGRRCANELAVHRYDAESARGGCRPIDRSLAVDGIDEILDTLLTLRERSGQADGESIHLHGTDALDEDEAPAEWLVTLYADRVDVARSHAKGDLALRASASDLELLLYRRPTLGPVERFGDESVLDLWYREFVL